MKPSQLIIKILLTLGIVLICPVTSLFILIYLSFGGFWTITVILGLLILPLFIPLIWIKKRKYFLLAYISFVLCFVILLATQVGIRKYNDLITINVTPSINVDEYLPFDDNSKIVKIDSQSLDFSEISKDELPIIDGAAAAFPVYSAFVNAVYPETTKLDDGVFEYNNTVGGYKMLANRKTDIFIGAAPSKEQSEVAYESGTSLKLTQIGSEAFVFFVHKNNPVENLSLEQIRGIYSGEITNWSEVGGKDEEIVPFQRNEGSGSQSMLIRLMGNTPIIEPTTQTAVGGMGGIIKEVADYKNQSSSIGFSFKFYVEGIIKNPDIKIIAIDGISPKKENIKNRTYPIIAPVYAVTYAGNPNENVDKFVDWMLSEEGQYIIEETGYVGVNN